MRPVTRITPRLPVGVMKSYVISSPLATHWRSATCEEFQCVSYRGGWRTIVDETTDLGQRQAWYIRNESGRHFRETREAGLTAFHFEPGQRCFKSDTHKVSLEREEIYWTRGGDWRGNPRGDTRRHANAADWLDDFANHQDKLATRLAQG